MKTSSVTEFLDKIFSSPEIAPNITHIETIKAKEALFCDFPSDVPRALVDAFKQRGIEKLYTHQAACLSLARERKNYCVLTPTASGKTLCYNLPVLEALIENPESRALYLFPTKALSQDQQAELNETFHNAPLGIKVYTFDGDTPSSLRIAAKDTGRIVISNPDMLHSGILPNHPKWIHFFANLRFVVIDEMHMYKGVFGSHVSNLLRRLKRIAAFYGSNPQFIFSSATIANPKELAEMLIEDSVELVSESGSPSGEKKIIFYNPPLLDRLSGQRVSSAAESEKLMLTALRSGVKTILFAKSRLRTELIAAGINKSLENIYTDNERIKVEPYRSGFLPSERRAIEKGLRNGSIHGVVSTNALELGIDIGSLDCAILSGFPSSFASFWQESGRSGRRNSLSISILVASQSALDQYLIKNPEYFFKRGAETARIDANNPYIYSDHVRCAAFELPFHKNDVFGTDLLSILEFLEEDGALRLVKDRYHWSERSYPGESVSLRSASADTITIIDETSKKNAVIGEMDRASAKELIYDDAVYIHRGRQYIVLKLDLENKICKVEERDVNYYTDAVVKTDLKVLEVDNLELFEKISYALGDVLVRSEATKFKKLTFHTHENIGYGEIFLPEEEMHTRAIALLFYKESESGKYLFSLNEAEKGFVLAHVSHIMLHTIPSALLCETKDLGASERVNDPHFAIPALYFYDKYPGGTGLVEAIPSVLSTIINLSLDIVSHCSCLEGCPSCIGAIDEKELIIDSETKGRKNLKNSVLNLLRTLV